MFFVFVVSFTVKFHKLFRIRFFSVSPGADANADGKIDLDELLAIKDKLPPKWQARLDKFSKGKSAGLIKRQEKTILYLRPFQEKMFQVTRLLLVLMVCTWDIVFLDQQL